MHFTPQKPSLAFYLEIYWVLQLQKQQDHTIKERKNLGKYVNLVIANKYILSEHITAFSQVLAGFWAVQHRWVCRTMVMHLHWFVTWLLLLIVNQN